MNKMTIEMPAVKSCAVSQCSYNANNNCHAKAITVGDTIHPDCDTFFSSRARVQERSRVAGVGACKVSGCRHNADLECTAPSIEVGGSGRDVQCLTFDPLASSAAV